ncbi:hypothetical protein SI65_06783 [Aspergillus cristatus]|uniref:Uncharacterized protein n=1 Tax=Aspergillus cristatus TaxID=573508 RepID=A0A1E3BAL1_ASPCR|nr:hypothetical protein SI65_06783 [Aspergillus cristatus]
MEGIYNDNMTTTGISSVQLQLPPEIIRLELRASQTHTLCRASSYLGKHDLGCSGHPYSLVKTTRDSIRFDCQ